MALKKEVGHDEHDEPISRRSECRATDPQRLYDKVSDAFAEAEGQGNHLVFCLESYNAVIEMNESKQW